MIIGKGLLLMIKEKVRGKFKIKRNGWNLYQKFTVTIILLGLVPMIIISTFIANRMIKDYTNALSTQYEQAAGYVSSSMASMLDSYNTISKMPYYYNFGTAGEWDSYLSFDKFRQIIYGDGYEAETIEEERKKDMGNFLQYVQSVDPYINGVHIIAQDEKENKLSFHYSNYNTFFADEDLFEEMVSYEEIDRQYNKLMLIPTHATSYFYGTPDMVFTVARNYFDLRGTVGHTPYVGTIFIDVDLKKMERIFSSVEFTGNEVFYVINEENDCFYSNEEERIGNNITYVLENLRQSDKQLVITTKDNGYGLQVVVVMNTEIAYGAIKNMQHMMYFFIGASVIALFAGSVFFSKRLTRPMHEMMDQMSLVETGNFDIELPVRSGDEIGILAERFNQMSSALKKYINQSYVSQIKQSEAELTALKSQIYPHFLYNTLEIIRMTALEEKGHEKVPEMIESLSEQIRYLIGPMQDVVPLEQEIDIVRKYVYLLNCRIEGKVQITVAAQGASRILVPKLILQPIIENAYVHGIKPKNGNGSIMIEIAKQGNMLEILIMDNGVGMDDVAIDKINSLLEGNEPGIKNEYNWQSIGLKNVHDRIRYLYGDEYGIRITSTLAVGTMVRLILPLREADTND
ncbi:sensor histidine kinase [Kineothrix sp. MB12-C1]|uniref:sensor histidine kinase n=1 Tax=Kineothrix sp. MB12-C1 TaxID=3070215 RepID=UPI0027D22F94|nr:histidine kinase [Kineothrix sp. MB12-C1]WMC91938.1 histidine kinase [Kineothrix sp. MB12-C1]